VSSIFWQAKALLKWKGCNFSFERKSVEDSLDGELPSHLSPSNRYTQWKHRPCSNVIDSPGDPPENYSSSRQRSRSLNITFYYSDYRKRHLIGTQGREARSNQHHSISTESSDMEEVVAAGTAIEVNARPIPVKVFLSIVFRFACA
jgi:hypothetical protein